MPKVKYRLFSVLLTTLKMLFYSSTEEIQPCASPQRSIASEEVTYSDKGTTTYSLSYSYYLQSHEGCAGSSAVRASASFHVRDNEIKSKIC